MTQLLFALSRYAHLLAVIIALGGTFMLKYAVLPMLDSEDGTVRQRMLETLRRRLAWIIPYALAALLISGVINMFRVFTSGLPLPMLYHILIGIKVLLAMPLFAVSLMLTAPGEMPNRFQRNSVRWLAFNAHLGFLIVAISVALRFLNAH